MFLSQSIKHTPFSCVSCLLILLKVKKETLCPLIQGPTASLQILLFLIFFSPPPPMEDSCPDVKSRIILIAHFSDSRLMLAPQRPKLGFCLLPILSWLFCVQMRNFSPLALDLSSPSQHSISWFVGKLLPVMRLSKE